MIITGTYWIVVILFLPETQRKVVGNGSIATKGIHRSLFDSVTRDRKSQKDNQREATEKR